VLQPYAGLTVAVRRLAQVLSEVPENEVLRGIVHTDAKLPASLCGARSPST